MIGRNPDHVVPFADRPARGLLIALLGTSAMLAASATVANAQAIAANATEAPVETDANAAVKPEVITVTGTRIVRGGFQSPTPMAVIGTEQISASASSNIAQVLTTLPVFTGSGSPSSNVTTGSNAAAGINSLNLRSLGVNRTLVLVDGHRVAPSLSTGVVDINSIPQALVSRVDVVTGGVSSVYGSDAVAGVVNFILDKEFSGLKGEVSGGATRYGDGENYKLSLAGGTRFAGDRGHIMVAGEHVINDGVGPGSRDWNYAGLQTYANPAYTATNGLPQRLVLFGSGHSAAAPGGIVVSGPLRGTSFGQGGQVYQTNFGPIVSNPFMQGGDWRINDMRPYNAIAPEERRQMAFARGSFEVSEALNLYAQFSYTKARIQADCCNPYMIDTSGPLIRVDNAYLPAAVRTSMIANNLTTIRVGTYNIDLGTAYQVNDRETTSYSLGAEGRFQMLGNPWRWDTFVQQGKSQNFVTFPNNISRNNYTLAVDAVVNPATGTVVCRSTLTNPTNGCSPWNALGFGVNAANSAGASFIHSPSISNLDIKQTVAAGSLTGEVFSTWAGPVSAALSAEYRKDSALGVVDAVSLAANHVFANFAPIDGSTSVKEAAIETAIPLARGQSWAQSLEVNAAARYTSYSLAGNVTTSKAGLTYSPISDVKFRVTKSRDIRAPNLQELFLPSSTARQSQFDPFTSTTPAFDQVTTGNPNLVPEKANTLGAGIVLKPSFLPGFNASVDYWSIDLKDAIAILNAQNVLALCFDRSRPELCSLITRDANNLLVRVIQQNRNIASLKTRGIDFEASYRTNLDKLGVPGSLDLHANATRYLESTVDSGISAALDFVGENGGNNPPRWSFNSTLTYTLSPFRAAITARGFSSGTMFGNFVECTSGCPASTAAHPTVNYNRMPGRVYLDLAFSYDFTLGDRRKATAFFNVRNLANKDPGLTAQGNFFGNGANAAVLYEVEGTVFRAGVRFRF
jgi:iron complex outermembrane recepter protein